MKAPSVALCMIVRDEAHVLGGCLDSVRELVTEYCIVDTGSTDGTLELLRERGITSTHIKWENDFAAARNVSLKMATADWVLVLDADEAFAASDIQNITAMLKHSNTCWQFLQRHYTADPRLSNFTPCRGEHPAMERNYPGYFESGLVRLFPNHAGVTYRGRVHELVEHSINEMSRLTIRQTPVRIHHYGHTPEACAIKREKGQLYTDLGSTKASESPKDWKAFYELGVQHNTEGRLQESAAALQQSATLNPSYADTWVNLGYVLCELKKSQEAIDALHKAIQLAPENPEAWCNAGVVKLRQDDFGSAERLFRRAVTLRPHYVTALCNLGLTFARQGRFAEASLWYNKALKLMPECVTALLDMAVIFTHSGDDKAAASFMQRAVSYAGNDQRIADTFTTIKEASKTRNARVNAPTSPQQTELASSPGRVSF